MTGGGFGGCVVALVARERAEAVIEAVRRDYRSPSGEEAHCHLFRPSAGVSVLSEGAWAG
jgi:galactokinase